MVTLQNSTALERIYADVPEFAYAMAVGKDTLTDVGDRLFRAALSEPAAFTTAVVGNLYDAIYAKACEIGRAKGKPMKEQKRTSRNSQASKLACFPLVAILAQDNDAVVPAYEWLRNVPSDVNGEGLGVSGYVKVCKALVAIKDVIAKDADADEITLRDAIVVALEPKATTASAAVRAIADAWEALAHGTDKGPSEYQAQFAALLVANPGDPAKSVGQTLADIAAAFETLEARAADAARKAKGGLSI